MEQHLKSLSVHGFGGKIELGETILECAERELLVCLFCLGPSDLAQYLIEPGGVGYKTLAGSPTAKGPFDICSTDSLSHLGHGYRFVRCRRVGRGSSRVSVVSSVSVMSAWNVVSSKRRN